MLSDIFADPLVAASPAVTDVPDREPAHEPKAVAELQRATLLDPAHMKTSCVVISVAEWCSWLGVSQSKESDRPLLRYAEEVCSCLIGLLAC